MLERSAFCIVLHASCMRTDGCRVCTFGRLCPEHASWHCVAARDPWLYGLVPSPAPCRRRRSPVEVWTHRIIARRCFVFYSPKINHRSSALLRVIRVIHRAMCADRLGRSSSSSRGAEGHRVLDGQQDPRCVHFVSRARESPPPRPRPFAAAGSCVLVDVSLLAAKPQGASGGKGACAAMVWFWCGFVV